MTLQDLKTGMVVEMRDGRKRQQCKGISAFIPSSKRSC